MNTSSSTSSLGGGGGRGGVGGHAVTSVVPRDPLNDISSLLQRNPSAPKNELLTLESFMCRFIEMNLDPNHSPHLIGNNNPNNNNNKDTKDDPLSSSTPRGQADVALGLLLGLLDDPSLASKTSTLLLIVKSIKILSRRDVNRLAVGHNGIQSLLSCIRVHTPHSPGSDDAAIAREAANALLNICYERDNVYWVLKCQGLDLLLHLLSSSSSVDCRISSAGAILSICVEFEGQHRFLELDGIPIVVRCMSSTNPLLRARAAGILHNLSQHPSSIRPLREKGAIPALVECLSDDDSSTISSSAGAIQNIARELRSRKMILSGDAGEVVPRLIELLFSHDLECQVKAAAALLNLVGPLLDQDKKSDGLRAGLRSMLTDGIVLGVLSDLFDDGSSSSANNPNGNPNGVTAPVTAPRGTASAGRTGRVLSGIRPSSTTLAMEDIVTPLLMSSASSSDLLNNKYQQLPPLSSTISSSSTGVGPPSPSIPLSSIPSSSSPLDPLTLSPRSRRHNGVPAMNFSSMNPPPSPRRAFATPPPSVIPSFPTSGALPSSSSSSSVQQQQQALFTPATAVAALGLTSGRQNNNPPSLSSSSSFNSLHSGSGGANGVPPLRSVSALSGSFGPRVTNSLSSSSNPSHSSSSSRPGSSLNRQSPRGGHFVPGIVAELPPRPQSALPSARRQQSNNQQS